MTKTKENKFDEGADNLDKFVIEPEKTEGFVDRKAIDDMKDDETIPDMSDAKWSEYVLSNFEDDEVIDGNVLTDGLRRVVNKILGPIVKSVPTQIVAPNINNNFHALVAWEVTIRFNDDGSLRTFGDVADVYEGNTPDNTFAKHASATAATKAEGRALRKALQLKRILAAEELSTTTAEMVSDGKINGQQIMFIDMMCRKLDINVEKLISSSRKEKYNKIEDVPKIAAVIINKYLSECMNGKDAKGNPRVIPESIKGYDSNWRKV